MTDEQSKTEKRNLPIMTGQSTFAQAAWTMASPSIVMTFLAVSLELPVLLVGWLVTIRQLAGTVTDIFLYDSITRIRNRKLALSLTDLALGACFVIAIAAALLGGKITIMISFAVVIFVLGLIDESQTLLLTDFVGDNLRSKSRMRMRYMQLALGGVIAIALTLIAHELTHALPPLHRHSIVISVGVACFIIAGFATLAIRDVGGAKQQPDGHRRSPWQALKDYFLNVFEMLRQPWFRRYMGLRVLFVAVFMSVPFFALISAESHHHSDKGLTALIVSTAAGAIVSGPLWRALNSLSHRAVMVSSTLLVALTGLGLIIVHVLGLDHTIHAHAASMFIITVATNGLATVRGLYFLDVAPSDQRARGVAVARSISRVIAIALSAALAAIAHMHETVWAIVFIATTSLLAAIASYWVVRPVKIHEHVSP